MSKISVEVRTEGVEEKAIYDEITKGGYSENTMVRPISFTVIFDNTEDLVRFSAFLNNYNKKKCQN